MGQAITADTFIEAIMAELVGRHMLGEFGAAISVYEASALFRQFDHKRRALHPTDTLRALRSMERAGFLTAVGMGKGARFALPEVERVPMAMDVVAGRSVNVYRPDVTAEAAAR